MASQHKPPVRAILIIAIVVSVATALAIYFYRSRQPQEIVLSGTVEAHSATVGSLVGGRVHRVLVQEGDAVVAGQPLVTLETENTERLMREQQAQIRVAGAQLQNALSGSRPEEIARAEAVYENADRERQRMGRLLAEGIVSREAFDRAATQARTTSKELQLLRKGSRVEEIAAARAQLDREQQRLAVLDEQKSEAVIAAPAPGNIQSVSVRPGDLVGPNQGVAEIIEPGRLWVRVFVPETLLGVVKAGAQVYVTVDSFPGRRFSGRIAQINTQGEYTPRNIQTRSQRADQVFGVKVFIDPTPVIKPGMAAEVDLGVKGRA